MKSQSLAGRWQFRQIDSDEWLPAQVPGGVHTDLLAAGRIPDPFVSDHEKRVQWVAETDWEYRHRFSAAKELLAEAHVFLVCDGLDTLAEVSLNGQLLGKANNMFRQYRWEVKSLLNEGENEIVIVFPSPVRYIAAQQQRRPMPGVSQAIEGAPHIRKAPCQFGWDWGPMLPPIGIWKDIRLEGGSVARLDDVHLRQRHQEGRVTIEAALTVERWQNAPVTATLTVTGPEGQPVGEARASLVGESHTLSVPIAQPRLWWPNGYGDQPLYKVDVLLSAEEDVLDQRTFQMGLRTLELRQTDDEWGKSFTFVVNGVPIFAKGSDWIPADSFPTRISDAHLEKLIHDTAATHQNMLRVWGGGFFEEERFYDLCDRYGLLIWQDFIFSCSIYPLDEEDFLENVRLEVMHNVRRLRHRASLALWCGNNEMEWGWESWGWSKLENEEALVAYLESSPALRGFLSMLRHRQLHPEWQVLREAYRKFFYSTLPEWVSRYDPDTPYWPSSPSSNTPMTDVNGVHAGDTHNWEVWHGNQPFKAYREHPSRFVSEFGFQSLPPLETIRAYADESEWNMTSYIMEHHQRNSAGNGKIITYMTDHFRMPKDFESLVYLTQVLQAEAVRTGVEHWRRHRACTSGTLYWQLNDCWPVASWSSLDYFGRWKALHYAARRFYAPVLLSVEDNPPKMDVHVTSDRLEPWEGALHWSLETVSGEVLDSGREKVMAPPLADTLVKAFDFGGAVSENNEREVVFVCELWRGEERIALTVAPFAPSKHLALTPPGIAVEVRQDGGRLVFSVRSSSLARFVELTLEGVDAVFSDNYFDLPAGREVVLTTPLPTGWSVEQARAAVRVRSLRDTF